MDGRNFSALGPYSSTIVASFNSRELIVSPALSAAVRLISIRILFLRLVRFMTPPSSVKLSMSPVLSTLAPEAEVVICTTRYLSDELTNSK